MLFFCEWSDFFCEWINLMNMNERKTDNQAQSKTVVRKKMEKKTKKKQLEVNVSTFLYSFCKIILKVI